MSATVTTPSMPAPPPAARLRERRPWWRTLLSAIPGVVVFALLGVVMAFGHHNGWKLPKMSALAGTAAPQSEDWCTEHLVPESICVECQPALDPKGEPVGFCREHGVAECVIHFPELSQSKGEPRLPQYDTVAALGVMARKENNSRNTLHTRRVQFATAESVEKAGIDVDVVYEQPMTEFISANGELVFDPTRVAHLSTRVPGTVAFVYKTVGDDVEPGEILALVDAVDVGKAKAELVQAVVQLQLQKDNVARLEPLAKSGAVPQRTMIEADAAYKAAEIGFISARQALANLGFDVPDDLESSDPKQLTDRLRFLGLPSELVEELPAGTKTANLIPVRAPYGGVVVDADIVAGEVVDAASSLYTAADPQRMWLVLNVRQEDARYVKRGQSVRFKTDHGQHEVAGQISWISPAIDKETRTLQVRVTVQNPDGRLRDKTFGDGRIILREEPNAIVVPREAVQATSDATFVFVRDKRYFEDDAPKVFHVRQVRVGAQDDSRVELLAGVLPGEVVATRGSAVLLAQLLRSNLGAGCGCHE